MKRIIGSFPQSALIAILLVVLFLGPACSLVKTGVPADVLKGKWEGIITLPDETKVDVYIEFYTNADGDYEALLNVPQQTEDTMLIEDVALDNKTLTFTVEEAPATFKGTVESNNMIKGEFTQGENLMPAVFKRAQ
ncbi:hypothetical protein ACFL6K_03515 [Candidatus Latescibacterota bacterium]